FNTRDSSHRYIPYRAVLAIALTTGQWSTVCATIERNACTMDASGRDSGTGRSRGRGGYRGELHTRPAGMDRYHGIIGEEVQLLSNYFRLQTPTNVVINNFHVTFEPSIEATDLRRKMIYGIKDLFDASFIFDGMSNIKSLTENREERNHVVKNPADADQNVNIQIRWTEEVPWGAQEMMRMYNTKVRTFLRYIGYVLMGRNHYDVKSGQDLPEFKIRLLPGVVTAVGEHDAGIMMVVDSSTKFVRANNVLQLLGEARNKNPSGWLDDAKKTICGQIVMTQYNNQTYRVDDLVTDKNPETATFDRNGVSMNLLTYYKQHHNITIKVKNQPLIECLPNQRDRRAGRTSKYLLVPELCQMTGLTDQMRADFNLMKKIGDVSRLKPLDRANNLRNFITRLTTNEKVIEDMAQWDLRFDKNLVQVAGRVLPCERIYMNGDTDNSAALFNQRSGDFGKEIRSKRLYKSCTITKWMIILTQRDQNCLQEFMNTITRVAGPLGIQLLNPRTEVLQNDRIGSFVDACNKLAPPCEMAVIIVPNNNKERYDAIKKVNYCEKPMPSQVIVAKNLLNKQRLMSVCTKIVIQMATKLGAEPWTLKIPPKDLMVVGYDTYHDSANRKRSAGGFVVSLNQRLSSWHSRVTFHEDDNEMSNNFAHNIKEGIKRYFDVNKSLPNRIIIYRDGVSEGQINHVYNVELKQVVAALKQIKPVDPPKLSFVIVTKRINARFFTAERPDNPIPGTIVDKTVTRTSRYDFYLISQSVRQGTVAPTMYNIIHDESGFKPEHHQQLAYKLTHLYYNWQGTVRVPAPCQYAHKLAFLTGNSLHREPSDILCDLLPIGWSHVIDQWPVFRETTVMVGAHRCRGYAMACVGGTGREWLCSTGPKQRPVIQCSHFLGTQYRSKYWLLVLSTDPNLFASIRSRAGRSRGRARGRPTTVAEPPPLSEGGNGGNGGNGGGNGDQGGSVRGRAGYRGAALLRTIPAHVKVKSGEGGAPVKVVANYFRLNTPKDVLIYDYHV
ncbi:unnamed protein product, partial [Medioppia subpectinata]